MSQDVANTNTVARDAEARDEEVRRLNLENQQLREVIQDWKKDCARFVQENKRLQAEIQRLTDKYDFQLLVKREERLREALAFYAEGGVDLEPKPEKAHLYANDFPMHSPEWLARSMSDHWSGKLARETLKEQGR